MKWGRVYTMCFHPMCGLKGVLKVSRGGARERATGNVSEETSPSQVFSVYVGIILASSAASKAYCLRQQTLANTLFQRLCLGEAKTERIGHAHRSLWPSAMAALKHQAPKMRCQSKRLGGFCESGTPPSITDDYSYPGNKTEATDSVVCGKRSFPVSTHRRKAVETRGALRQV